MNALLASSMGLLLIALSLFNYRAIYDWSLNHKALGFGVYVAMAWGAVAGFVWMLYALADLL